MSAKIDPGIIDSVNETLELVPVALSNLQSNPRNADPDDFDDYCEALNNYLLSLKIFAAKTVIDTASSQDLCDFSVDEISPLLSNLISRNNQFQGMGQLSLDRPYSPTQATNLNITLDSTKGSVDDLIAQLAKQTGVTVGVKVPRGGRSSGKGRVTTPLKPSGKKPGRKSGSGKVIVVARRQLRPRPGPEGVLDRVRVTFAKVNTANTAGFNMAAEFRFRRVPVGGGTPLARLDVLQFAWDRYNVIGGPTQNLLTLPQYDFDRLRRTDITSVVNQDNDYFYITLNDGPGWTGNGANIAAAQDLWYVFSPVWGVVDTQTQLQILHPVNQDIGAVLNGPFLQTLPLFVSIQGARTDPAGRIFSPDPVTDVQWDFAANNWQALPVGGPFAALPATPHGY